MARTYGDLKAPGDQKETFVSGAEPVDGDPYYFTTEAEGHFAENIWPTYPSDMKQVWVMYRDACQVVADKLLNIMECTLKADKPISTLIVHHYPEQKTPHEGIRAGAHTDFGTLTSSFRAAAGTSDGSRGVIAGGTGPPSRNAIDYTPYMTCDTGYDIDYMA